MLPFTKQQQKALLLAVFLLLVGWAVKHYRLAHPPSDSAVSQPLR